MPSIRERLNLKGFESVESPQTRTPPLPSTKPGLNPFIRCPTPPTNADSDVLRQFNEDGLVPVRRILPLPAATVAGGNTTIIQSTNVSTSGSSSSGSSSASLVATSVTINIPTLAPNGTYQTAVNVARALQLIQLVATAAVEVRIYGTAASQGGDVSRSTDSAPPFETQAGLITDVVFDSTPYVWTWQNRIAANGDSPQVSNLYVTVVNPSSVTGVSASTVTIQYLPLEA